MNIGEPLRFQARVRADAAAVVRADGTAVSYAALDRIVDGFAAALAEAGVRQGETVALRVGWPDEFPGLVASFALARLGAASADVTVPEEHLRWRIVEGEGEDGRTPALSLPILWARARVLPPARQAEPRGGATLYRVFASSGTTGTAKFVPLSAACMTARVQSYLAGTGGAPVARVCATGYGTTVGFSAMLRTFWAGGALVLTNPEHLLESINRWRVASLVIAPAALADVLRAMPPQAPAPASLAVVECLGSALPRQLRAEAERRLCRTIWTNYGSLETGPIAAGPVTAFGDDPLAAGFVLPGVEVEVLDEDGVPGVPGTEGVLRIRSSCVAAGYLGEPACGEGAFAEGCFRTCDIGSMDGRGALRLAGRVGDLINAGGVKIRPGDVEDVLLAIPGVSDAAAFGVPDALGVIEPWAAIVADPPIAQPVLATACGEKLGPHAPRRIIFVTELPRNANGKVLRGDLVRAAIAFREREEGVVTGAG